MKNNNLWFLALSFICVSLNAQEDQLQKAEKLYASADFEGVIALLARVEDKSVNHYFLEGKAYYELKDFSKSIELFVRCVDLDPKNAENHYWLGASNIEALQGDDNFFKKGIYAFDAQDALIDAIELKPSHISARIRLANYYLNAPLIAGGSTSKAKEQAMELMKYDKVQGNALLASVYRHNEEYDKAEEVYFESIKRNENSEKVYYLLAEISLEKKDYKKSFEYLKQSIKYYPNYKMSHYQFGKLSVISKQNIQEGIEHLKKYIESDKPSNLPADYWAYYRLGQLYSLINDDEAAKKAFSESIRLNSKFDKAKEALKSLR